MSTEREVTEFASEGVLARLGELEADNARLRAAAEAIRGMKEPTHYSSRGYTVCTVCEGYAEDDGPPLTHDADCPWVIARAALREGD